MMINKYTQARTMPSTIDTDYSLSAMGQISNATLIISPIQTLTIKTIIMAQENLSKIQETLKTSAELYGQSQIIQAEGQLALARKQLETLNETLIRIKNGAVSMMEQVGENELRESERQIALANATIEEVRKALENVTNTAKSVAQTIGDAEMQSAQAQSQQSQAILNLIKSFF